MAPLIPFPPLDTHFIGFIWVVDIRWQFHSLGLKLLRSPTLQQRSSLKFLSPLGLHNLELFSVTMDQRAQFELVQLEHLIR